MDQAGGIGIGNLGYYRPILPLKSVSGYQFISSVAEQRDTKNILFNGAYPYHSCGIPEPSAPIEFVRDGWLQPHRDKSQQPLSISHHNFTFLPEPQLTHPVQLLEQADPLPLPSSEKTAQTEEPNGKKGKGSKKRAQGNSQNTPKPKKPKKNPVPKGDAGKCKVSRPRTLRKTADVVINGMDLDISGIPTPVCSCTGKLQQCYRWGLGGWQSACCTTSISMYPLPMSTKRRGARIAGRKMSLGAFKKVLEKLAGEGYNLSNPIDLKNHWAKHGTNKFVIIR